MQLAYLVNQYPAPSHTFIRREIAAIEALGTPVERFTLRASDGQLRDPADLEERRRTRVVLDVGPMGLLGAVAEAAVRAPRRFARALGLAVDLARGTSRGVVVGLVYFAEACQLLRWFRTSRTSHVHVHFGTNAATVALLVRRLGGPPFSVTIHGPEEFDRPEELAIGRKVAGSAFAVAISDYGRSQLYRWCDRDDWPKIHTVRCGVDSQVLGSEVVPIPDTHRLVAVGRLSEQKGQLILVEAMSRLVELHPDVQLSLVGDGPMRATIEAAIARTGCTEVVHLRGMMSTEEVLDEIRGARAMVLPSFAEGLPIVLMESLALSRPVVATFVAGIPELVDETCGWLVPAGSVSALVDALSEVLTLDAPRLEEMGRVGRERIRAEHDVTRQAARLLDLILASVAPATRDR